MEKAGKISEERLDDAVSRILRVKFMSNMFDEEINSAHEKELLLEFGSQENREVARRAVRESLVLLKNGEVDGELALDKIKNATNITVCGTAAFDIGRQCGGWTIFWEGKSGNITAGTPIIQGIYDEVKDHATVSHSVKGDIDVASDVIVTVIGETLIPRPAVTQSLRNLSLSQQMFNYLNQSKKMLQQTEMTRSRFLS